MSEPTGISDSARHDTERTSVSKSTAVICSECGKGNYRQSDSNTVVLVCTVCAHAITWGELEADENEWFHITDGVVHVVQS